MDNQINESTNQQITKQATKQFKISKDKTSIF